MLLSEDDVEAIAEPSTRNIRRGARSSRTPGRRRSRQLCARSGGQLVASGRIPVQALLAAIEADEEENEEV